MKEPCKEKSPIASSNNINFFLSRRKQSATKEIKMSSPREPSLEKMDESRLPQIWKQSTRNNPRFKERLRIPNIKNNCHDKLEKINASVNVIRDEQIKESNRSTNIQLNKKESDLTRHSPGLQRQSSQGYSPKVH